MGSVKLDTGRECSYTGIMLHFLPGRILLFLFFFFLFLFLPGKTLAAHPTANISISPGPPYQKDQSYYITVNASDPDCNLNYGQVQATRQNGSPVPNWIQVQGDFGLGGCNYTSGVVWIPSISDQYYITANIYDDTLPTNEKCSQNPYIPLVNDPCPPENWCKCGAGDLMNVYVGPPASPSPSSVINSLTVEPRHNIYDICQNSLPYPNSIEPQLLSYLDVNANITNYGGEGFNGYRIYVSWQNGDSAPPNTTQISQDGQQWWRSNAVTFIGGGSGNYPGTYWLQGLPTGTGTRTVRIVLYNSSGPCEACPGYSAVKGEVTNQKVDRNAPSYSTTYTSPNWSGSPHLRTVTGGSYTPTGTVGTTVTLQVNPITDTGGFGIDRVDLWVANAVGDDLSTIRSGNLACAPSPPYSNYFGDLCKTNGPMNCANFSPGAGQAWYIGQANSGNSWSVPWDTDGFATGTRYIVANAFDCGGSPGCTRIGPNILTYTGNGVPANSAQVTYTLTLPIQPWIKTTGGDVHTNASIITQGGP